MKIHFLNKNQKYYSQNIYWNYLSIKGNKGKVTLTAKKTE